jgi:TolB protein
MPAAPTGPAPAPTVLATPTLAPLAGRLVFSAKRSGRWDLYAANPNGGAWEWLTADGTAREPVVSPDGTRIAFRSHRDGNWELYSMSTAGGSATRLTRNNEFDGQPSWSPDGKQIAFASTRQDDLDIWVMNADGTGPVDLTKASPAVDDTPAWSPDSRWIAFTSWRDNNAQIYVVSPDGKQTANISKGKSNDQRPAWSPDGKRIAFVSDRDGQQAIYVADFGSNGIINSRRLTYSGWDDRPAWSPDGKSIAFVSPRPGRQAIYLVPAEGGIARAIGPEAMQVESMAWVNISAPLVDNLAQDPPAQPLYVAPPADTAGKLVPMKDVYLAPSYGEMSNLVSDSFEALRARVKAEAGWDFLGVLSDMTRQLTGGVCGDGCEIMSWHKTGRAVDSRLEIVTGGEQMIEIVREDQLGETYWHVYLRAAKQDGTLGEPLTEPPWDWTYYARWTLAPHQGGVLKTIPVGYYVDFTQLAHDYGWNRISSYDDPQRSWKENNTGMEFWHFQKTGGLAWYPALQELYSRDTLTSAVDWNELIKEKQDNYLLPLKGIPAPPGAWRWFALSP